MVAMLTHVCGYVLIYAYMHESCEGSVTSQGNMNM